MNRGRLRRYALRVLAAASLGVALIITAGGIAHADTITGPDPTYVGRTITPPGDASPGQASADETTWS
jgi:hypothetical protein